MNILNIKYITVFFMLSKKTFSKSTCDPIKSFIIINKTSKRLLTH